MLLLIFSQCPKSLKLSTLNHKIDMISYAQMDPSVQRKLENFFSKYKLLSFKKGEVLVRAENPIFGVYLLKKGYIRQYVVSEDGDEITINIFRPISFIPMMLIIGQMENKYFFEAATPVEVWRAPVDKTLEFIKNDPEVLYNLAKRFAQGLNGIAQRLEDLMFENAEKRVGSLLSYLLSRFGEKDESNIVINLPLTHKDIAAWVNLTRETASRQIEKLIKQGIISYKNHLITVYQPQKLHKL